MYKIVQMRDTGAEKKGLLWGKKWSGGEGRKEEAFGSRKFSLFPPLLLLGCEVFEERATWGGGGGGGGEKLRMLFPLSLSLLPPKESLHRVGLGGRSWKEGGSEICIIGTNPKTCFSGDGGGVQEGEEEIARKARREESLQEKKSIRARGGEIFGSCVALINKFTRGN